MLLGHRDPVPTGDDWTYEVKWDGIRAIVVVDEGVVRIKTRSLRDVTPQFPELCMPEVVEAGAAIFDGEIVCLDDIGKPAWGRVMRRLQTTGAEKIQRAMDRDPVTCILFDCLYLDSQLVIDEDLAHRRQLLSGAIRTGGNSYRVSEVVEDGPGLFDAVQRLGLEGVVAKQRHGKYLPGQRSTTWLKTKVQHTMQCCIVGYVGGHGGRQVAALRVARPSSDGGFDYLGKIGSGLDQRSRQAVTEVLKKLPPAPRPVIDRQRPWGNTTWVEPRWWCEVRYASVASTGTLREPVFVRLCPDGKTSGRV